MSIDPVSEGPAGSRAARRRAARARVRLTALLGCLLACAVNPQTGKREVVLMSEETEREIDAEMSQQVEAQLGLVDNPELAEYVSALGAELAAGSLRRNVDYVFSVVEMDEPNAFALPGGHVYVSRGLVLLANSEAELANVLGHEIGHVAARHAAGRDARQKLITAAALLGSVAAAAAGSPEAAAAGGQFLALGGVQQAVAAYSREQEAQADRIGQDLTSMAGIDPAGMSEFLNQLDNYTRLKQGFSRQASWFDTHPATPGRVAETATRAEVLRWVPRFSIAPAPDAYLGRISGLSVGKPASEGVIQGRWLLHPELDFAVAFPPGWEIQNGHSRVLAVAPGRDALVMLELSGEGDDPRAAAAADAEEMGLKLDEETPIFIGKLPAFRARTKLETPAGVAKAWVTWVAHQGLIYRLSGSAAGARFARYRGAFRSYARSFRDIRPEELRSIVEPRLRLAVAREGESLEALSARSENEWNLSTTAVMNGLQLDSHLEDGQLVKIQRSEPYVPKSKRTSDPSDAPEPAFSPPPADSARPHGSSDSDPEAAGGLPPRDPGAAATPRAPGAS